MNKNNFHDKLMIVANQNINEKKFWHEKLSENNSKTIIPYDYQNNKPIELCTYQNEIPGDISQRLIQISKGSKDGLHMILIAGLFVFLNRRYKENNILIGTPVYKVDSNNELINKVLPIQGVIDESSSFREILSLVKRIITEADKHQNYPMGILSSQLDIDNTNEFFPLFEIALMVEGIHDLKYLEDINLNLILSFDISEQNKGIKIIYNSSIYSSGTIKQFETMFYKVLKEIIFDPGIAISEIEIISDAEKQELLYEFNDTKTNYPSDKTIHKLFEDQVSKNPDRILVSSGDVYISYNELNSRSNQLAWQLKELGVDVGDVVGLNTERTEELIIGILGILKCGAAYLPLNSDWPKERINFMLIDSCCTILIHGGTAIESKEFNCDLLNISDQDLYKKPKENLDLAIKSSNTIYIIYTSGTTGNPKGVITTHMNVSRVVLDTEYISINSRDNILQLSSYTFDGSVFDIYGALLNGSGLVMINNDDLLDIGMLLDIISKKQISIFFLTTALFNTIVDYGMSKLKAVRKILFGGERISVQHTQRALEELGEGRLVHVYGPTETTVFASYHNINSIDEERETIPIGTPLSNTSIYLFDSGEQLVPKGVKGEIYIGGHGNAKGYLNNPELTNDKFVTNPYNIEDVLYRTGDLARFLPDGSIEFEGRIDHQVKIRGFRIELGEIENVLLKHESIKEIVVLAREDKGDKYLCAYYVRENDFNQEEARAFLSENLPDYMIPSYFVELDKMPLTTNGKIDRKILPLPEITAGDEYVAPRNETDEKLVAIWSEVLNIPEEEISITSNFFNIGGHSLKATILLNKLFEEIGFELKLSDFFNISTIKEISDVFLLVNDEQEGDDNYKEISI